MSGLKKNRKQLLDEIAELRARLGQLEDAEAKRKPTEERSRIILQTAMDGFCIVDTKGDFKDVNEAYCRITGYTKDELLSMNVRDIEALETMAETAERLEKIKKSGVERFETCLKCKDGGRVDVEVSVNYMPSDNGQLFAVVRDITAHKQAEEALRESEERYRAIFEQAADSIVLIDGKTGALLEFNDRTCESLGYTREEFQKLKIPDFEVIESAGEVSKHIEKIIRQGSDVFETKHRTKDGRIQDILVSSKAISVHGKDFVQSIWCDITERKRAEEELRLKSEITANMIEGVYLIRADDSVIVYTNPKFAKMFGYGPDEMVGKHVSIVNAPTDKSPEELAREIMESLNKTGEWRGEINNIKKDGTCFWCYANVSVFEHAEYGKVLISVHTDITERKQAEEQLQIRDKAIESSISAIAIVEPGGNLIYVNSAFLKMWGYDDFKEVVGKPAVQFWQFEDLAAEAVEVLHAKGKWTGELSARRKDGSGFDAQIMANIVKREAGEPDYIMASFLDITERKRTEKTLQESETRYRMVVEDQTELICRFMPGGVLTFVNDAYCRYFGRKHEELVGHSFMPLIPEEDRNKVNNQISQLNKENSTVTTEHRVIAQEGSIRWQQWTNRAIFDEQGNIIEYQAVGRDVTERRKTALALENRREFERLITDISRQFINLSSEQIDEGINQALKALGEFAEVDRSYIFQFFDEGRKMSNTHEWCAEGITPQSDNLQNLSVDMVPWWMGKLAKFENIHIPDVEKLPARAKNEKQILRAQAIQSLIVIPMIYNRELIGFVGFDSVRRQRTWSEEGIAMLTIVSEIFTNTLMRRRIQQELDSYYEKMRRAEQLASLGTVSATIAHELNQPLTVIKLFLQQGLRALKDDNDVDKVAEVINDCLDEVTKAASTVDRFRRFARKAAPIYVIEVDLVEVAERVVGLLTEGARRSKLNLSVNVENRPPHIVGNSVELEQMFFVLIQNAIQAADGETPQDMKITISSADNRIQLTFADTCGGIEQENIDKIFEPFFTTKPANVGTGLGLCILERIVKGHSGSVRVESQEGHGTIFYISLPVGN